MSLVVRSCTLYLLPPLRPPTSTLLPYTTLFRSRLEPRLAAAGYARDGARLSRARRLVVGERRRGDRKSTRLNSSHSQISYAVFCLKKKKNNADQSHTKPSDLVSLNVSCFFTQLN